MNELKNEIAGMGAQVLLVTYDDPSLLERKMMHDMECPFPLLIDKEKQIYRRWGMGRTNLLGAMLSPALNWRYLKLLLRGERFLGFAPDMFQLGGDFIVDRQGQIAFAHIMTNNGDRAEVSHLMQVLKRVSH